jgi:hypothetical protein
VSGIPDLRYKLLGYRPNDWAVEHIHSRDEQFISVVTCRQCGKTWAAAMEIDAGMSEPADELHGPPVVGVLSYDYKRAELSIGRYLDAVRKAFGDDYIRVNMNKHEAVVPTTGARLLWMSADDPEAGIGFTLSTLVVDEGQKVPDTVWEKLYPALAARHAKVRVFGTPDITPTQTWFRGLYLRGEDTDDTKYHSYTLNWRDNPWIALEDVKEAKRTISDREFRMLYEGEWVDAEGSVFGRLDAALIAPVAFDRTRTHVMAVDLAIRDDFTVVMVGEEATRRVVHCERWHETEPAETYDRIARIWETYGRPRVIGDESGMGLGMLPELRQRGMRVTGITVTAANKMPIIARLQGAIEHGRIRFPEWAPLITELKAYVYHDTPSGRIGAQAAYGFHDDSVMCLAFLNEGMRAHTSDSRQSTTYKSKPSSSLASAFGSMNVRQ